MSIKNLAPLLLLLGCITACDLTKDVDVDLPVYEAELVVECYLQVGEPYRLLLTRSAGFFDPAGLPLVDDALVLIKHEGNVDTLTNDIFINPTTMQLHNYGSATSPSSLDGVYELEIVGPQGDRITASTVILPPVPITELEIVPREEDSLVVVLTRIADPINEANFYRRLFHLGGDIVSGEVEQDFTAGDSFLEAGSELVFGTAYDYAPGDTLISTLYHITEEYYDFVESLETALNGNGNPFIQQESTQSNVVGGIGIFTGLSFDQKTVVIP